MFPASQAYIKAVFPDESRRFACFKQPSSLSFCFRKHSFISSVACLSHTGSAIFYSGASTAIEVVAFLPSLMPSATVNHSHISSCVCLSTSTPLSRKRAMKTTKPSTSFFATVSSQLCIASMGTPQSKTFKSSAAATIFPMVPPPSLYDFPIQFYI